MRSCSMTHGSVDPEGVEADLVSREIESSEFEELEVWRRFKLSRVRLFFVRRELISLSFSFSGQYHFCTRGARSQCVLAFCSI